MFGIWRRARKGLMYAELAAVAYAYSAVAVAVAAAAAAGRVFEQVVDR